MILSLVLSRKSSCDRIISEQAQIYSIGISSPAEGGEGGCQSCRLKTRTPVHASDSYDTLIIGGVNLASGDHACHPDSGVCYQEFLEP